LLFRLFLSSLLFSRTTLRMRDASQTGAVPSWSVLPILPVYFAWSLDCRPEPLFFWKRMFA